MEIVRWIGLAVGVLAIVVTLTSMLNTLVVPRMVRSTLAYIVWRMVRSAFLLALKPVRTYRGKDRVLSLLGPVAILALLAGWLLTTFIGYALILWPLIGNLGDAFVVSGSSIFTLGFDAGPRGAPTAIVFLAAATGLTVVALLIAYLPTIYAAYNRRETLVTMLESRAGEPAWGPEVLARQSFIGGLETLAAVYRDWEEWSADLAESHVSYPWLIFFRSPQPLRSWITSLLAVMDSAAMYLALAPGTAPSEARMALRMGFTALRAIAQVVQIPYDPDPLPDAPIMLSYEEFVAAVDWVRAAGFPIERPAEEAWTHFRGWRVNYESIGYALADLLVAVPSLWSGPRRLLSEPPMAPRRPAQRSPERPQGIVSAR